MKQLITFFIFAYLISWTIWLPLYGHLFGLNSLPSLPFQHALGALGPLLASLLTTWLFLKKDGLKILLSKCFQLKPLLYLLVALFSPFVVAFVSLVVSSIIWETSLDFSSLLRTKEFPGFHFLTFFFYNLIFFGLGEETGWRGFALPRFQFRFNALSSSLVLAVFWALWHLPLFFYRPGYTAMDITGIFGWIFSLLTGSILLTWLYNSSRGNILICAVFHSTIDIAFTSDINDEKIINTMGFLVTIWGILTIIIFKNRNLSSRSKEAISS